MNFYQKVYAVVRCIPPGKVAHYGQIAELLDNPRAARAVGYALRVLDDEETPWQRVIHATGEVRAGEGKQIKERQAARLRAEGVRVSRAYRVDMAEFKWDGLAPPEVAKALQAYQKNLKP